LARAAYSRAAVYLFDDPLSAVDVGVAGRIIRRLLSNEGLLSKTTRIVSSSNSLLLQYVNSIYDL
jgi:ABC-type Mn2+/Zn2+ transport system ATPase subunit